MEMMANNFGLPLIPVHLCHGICFSGRIKRYVQLQG